MRARRSDDGTIFFLSHLLPMSPIKTQNVKQILEVLQTCEWHELDKADRDGFVLCHFYEVEHFRVIEILDDDHVQLD